MGRKKGKGKGKNGPIQNLEVSNSQQAPADPQTLILHSSSYNQLQNPVLIGQTTEQFNNVEDVIDRRTAPVLNISLNNSIVLNKSSPIEISKPATPPPVTFVWGKKSFTDSNQSESSKPQTCCVPNPVPGPSSSITKTFSETILKNPDSRIAVLQQDSPDYGASGDFSDHFTIPTRKKITSGSLGRQLKVETNFLPLRIKPKSNRAIHYDVTFTPEKPKALIRIAFNKLIRDFFPGRYPAFDGARNMYSSSPLFESSCFNCKVNFISPENNSEKTYEIFIKFATYIDLTSLSRYMHNNESTLQVPQEALQCIDVILRNILNTSARFVQVGRSFFTPPVGQVVDLGDGMQLWHGVFTSAVLGWKPYLNIDVAHKGFPTTQTVSNYFQSQRINMAHNMSNYAISTCKKFLKGLKVQYMLPNQPQTKRSYKINDFTRQSARDQTFRTDEGAILTIEAYYKKYKGYTLQYPTLPCLWVGSCLKNIYIPSELCTILPGQVVLKKLTDMQTKNMIRQAATSTTIRKQKIMDALIQSGLTSDQLGLREFGLTIDSTFQQVDARVLDPPSLEYNGSTVEPKQGVWKPRKFLNGAVINNWTILNTDSYVRPADITSFSKQIIDKAISLGMDVKPTSYRPATTITYRRYSLELDQYFENAKNNKIDLVFVIVSNSGDSYGQIKQIAELKYGMLTQCLKAVTLDRMNSSTIENILMKVNAKLNGTNHIISLKHVKRPSVLNTPVIIVGADVTHPSPEQTSIPSVVGVAASHDPAAFKYNMCWRLQPPKVEIIEDLETIMKDHLLTFYIKTRQKPEKILFFRDGVSEGQFKQVLNSELTAIRRACMSLNPSYKPRITMMVVQKRHHTRFFPLQRNEGLGKNLNVPPGTVVDTNITHPTELDFYLVSHQSIQGVARPTKYRRLWDDNDMSEDEIEELTFYLCHMFSRCTRAVSYPAPTYYAHLAAYRGRVYLEGRQIILNNLPKEQESRQIHADVQKNKPMFFV